MTKTIKSFLILSILFNILVGVLLYFEYNNKDRYMVYQYNYEKIEKLSRLYTSIINQMENNLKKKDALISTQLNQDIMDAHNILGVLSNINARIDSYISMLLSVKQMHLNIKNIDNQTIDLIKQDSRDLNKLINYLDQNHYKKSSVHQKKMLLQNFRLKKDLEF